MRWAVGSEPLNLNSVMAEVMWASVKPISLRGTCISVGGGSWVGIPGLEEDAPLAEGPSSFESTAWSASAVASANCSDVGMFEDERTDLRKDDLPKRGVGSGGA